MAKYQVSLVERPANWQPKSPDDVPPQPGRLLSVLASADDVFSAVRQAIGYNQSSAAESAGHWAVVVEPGTLGRTWPVLGYVRPWPTKWLPSGGPQDGSPLRRWMCPTASRAPKESQPIN